MRPVLTALVAGLAAALAAAPAAAEDAAPELEVITPGEDNPLATFKWEKRPVVVFADSELDPRFERQMRELRQYAAEMVERDVVVIVDTTPGPDRFDTTPLREELRPRDFTLILIGKDGGVKLRRPNVQTARELMRAIDRMPMRQQEMGRR